MRWSRVAGDGARIKATSEGSRIAIAHELVVHCKRAAHDVYIGRPSKWGNPFVIGRDGTREEVIARYAAWLLEQPRRVARDDLLARAVAPDHKRVAPLRRAPDVDVVRGALAMHYELVGDRDPAPFAGCLDAGTIARDARPTHAPASSPGAVGVRR